MGDFLFWVSVFERGDGFGGADKVNEGRAGEVSFEIYSALDENASFYFRSFMGVIFLEGFRSLGETQGYY